MDILPIDIEVVEECEVDEHDLSEFVETEAMQLGDEQAIVGSKIVNIKNEGELIHQLLDGKLSFSDYKVQVLDADEEEDDLSDAGDVEEYIMGDEESDEEPSKETFGKNSSQFESELVSQRRDQLRGQFSKLASSGGKGTRRKKSVLPPALQGLMGEANLRYARGDTQMAETVCLEIIRQMPLAVEPFLTLAQIYEGKNPEKYMQFMLIAGHLNPSDVDHWLRLAEMSEEIGNLKQASVCYSKAVKAAPYELDIRMRRIDLTKKMGDERYALKLELHMIAYIKDPVMQMTLAREVAQKYHELGIPDRCLFAYRSAHKVNGDHFTIEDVNTYLELLIDAKMFEDGLHVLTQHTKIELEVTPRSGKIPHSIDKVTFPDDLIPDFRTKAAICLVHLKHPQINPYIIENALASFSVEDDGDCLLDIAEALMAVDQHEQALELLQPLIESEKFSLAAVFLRYADCHRMLGDTDKAIDSYRTVVQMAPQHLDARLTLSALLKQKNQHAEALQALEQDLESDVLDPTLLYEHCFMLKETGNIEQYIDLSGVLFSRHCIRFRNREEAEIGVNNRRILDSMRSVQEYREFRREDCEDTEAPEFIKSGDQELDKELEYEMFVDVVKKCYHSKRFATMQNYTHSAMTSKRFEKHRTEIQFMALVASIANKDYGFGAFYCKDFLMRNPGNSRAWNLYLANQQEMNGPMKYNRMLQRFCQASPDKVHADALLWKPAYHLAAGTYQMAVREFSNNFKVTKSAFSALLTAVSLSHLAVQKFSHHRTDHINQAIVYMNEYAKLREPEAEQEIYYNAGRLYQQLGLSAQAADYYKKVLACETHDDPEVAEIIDLKREAAFNLHLIYKDSGNLPLAKKYLYSYVVV